MDRGKSQASRRDMGNACPPLTCHVSHASWAENSGEAAVCGSSEGWEETHVFLLWLKKLGQPGCWPCQEAMLFVTIRTCFTWAPSPVTGFCACVNSVMSDTFATLWTVARQARILEGVAISYSGGSSPSRDRNCISDVFCVGRQILYHCTIWKGDVTGFSQQLGSISLQSILTHQWAKGQERC